MVDISKKVNIQQQSESNYAPCHIQKPLSSIPAFLTSCIAVVTIIYSISILIAQNPT